MIFLIQLMKVIFGRFLLLGIGGSIRVCSDGLILGTMLAQRGLKAKQDQPEQMEIKDLLALLERMEDLLHVLQQH